MSRRDDPARLQDMLDAARTAVSAAKGRTRADLERDKVWSLGIIKCIEIIGEAAGRVSEPSRAALPRLHWPKMVAMRNRLIHGYFEIDYDQVWIALTKELPVLIGDLERALTSMSPGEAGEVTSE